MLKHLRITPEFVEFIPQQLVPGILYISPKYRTVTHACCCGCGTEIVTPLGPADWKIMFAGESVTLSPSVGNWNIPCRSHYIIDRNRVVECAAWSQKEIISEQKNHKLEKSQLYGETPPTPAIPAEQKPQTANKSFWQLIGGTITKWF